MMGISSILLLIALAVGFFLLMRMGGCCAHGHNHGGHQVGGQGHPTGAPPSVNEAHQWTATDPVCGASGPPDNAAASLNYRDRMYYFCSTQCLNTFQANPERYATTSSSAKTHDHEFSPHTA